MSFSIDPLFPGDFYESARRLGADIASSTARDDDWLNVMREGWATAQSLGWSALLVPEDFDGVGATHEELAAVVEGIGHSGCSMPVASLCHAVPYVLALSQSPLAKQLLAQIASGDALVAAAYGSADTLTVELHDGKLVLNGVVHAVEVGSSASAFVLHGNLTSGEALAAAISAKDPGVSTREYLRMDGRVVADLHLQNVTVSTDAVLLLDHAAGDARRTVESFGVLFTAVESVAAMGRMLVDTIDYLKNRRQFGSNLSEFQVLRHAVADLYVDYEGMKAQTQALLLQTEAGQIDHRRCSLLMVSLVHIGRRFAESVIQLHGGMGMTEEVLAARQAKRLICAGFEYGGERRHLRLAAEETFGGEQTK